MVNFYDTVFNTIAKLFYHIDVYVNLILLLSLFLNMKQLNNYFVCQFLVMNCN